MQESFFRRRRRQTSAPLAYQVYVSGSATFGTTSVLISGAKECVLIDAQFTKSEAVKLADMVERSGKSLTTILITHGHPDHYFGLATILTRFPEAKAYAAKPVVDEIGETMQAKVAQWKPLYKDDLTDAPVSPTEMVGNTIELEDNELRVSGAVQGDSDRCTYVYVRSLGLVAAGDVAFNGSHLWLADTDDVKRKAWLKTLGRIERLRPKVIVAGHKAADLTDDSKRVLAGMRAYIAEFDEALDASARPEEVIHWMQSEFPAHENLILLKYSAEAAFAPQKP